MAATDVSWRQKRLLCWLAADDLRRTRVIASHQQEWVRALQGYKGHISHRVRTLEARNLLGIAHSSGGNDAYLRHTQEGWKWAMPLVSSCDEGIGLVKT